MIIVGLLIEASSKGFNGAPQFSKTPLNGFFRLKLRWCFSLVCINDKNLSLTLLNLP